MTPELKERVRTHWGAESATQNAGSELQGSFVDSGRVRMQPGFLAANVDPVLAFMQIFA
jgi:hypothetical protein